ncbi:enoyl-CoA hydratase/isomerase family protein [Marinobacter sp. 2_MG-2023]|uniref:enoyl-CoA hydratase/isomerase family protein n=1 Tax=Marinobacter sp. 2_MG-2023 TaxID=3062679 RepID=UPI0026E15E94|nr:enoyl-CoA hydratase-related protein [Marinobacter sp. 2_MG-2023]MDO6441431.1 enoyl-CoA hydratase-related protein [Marinobacter sp. 2_MG-2023]
MRNFKLEEKYESLTLCRSGRLLTITLNQPETLNAVGEVMHEELANVFYDAAVDPHSDVIVLTGAGRAFSAGGDVDLFEEMIQSPEVFEKIGYEAKRIVYSILDCEKPIIAKVNGHATGLGATIALLSDVIFASERAKIGDPHVRMGFVAGDGGAGLWPQLIGFARAKEYLLTGDLMTAQQAAQIGLINYAVPEGELDEAVEKFADRMLSGATKAIRWTKTAVNIELKRVLHSTMDASVAMEALSNITLDHKEAVQAFKEKREPLFGGQ